MPTGAFLSGLSANRRYPVSFPFFKALCISQHVKLNVISLCKLPNFSEKRKFSAFFLD